MVATPLPGSRPDDAAEALCVEGISKAYVGVPALQHVDLALQRGSIQALAGQNGAGKSTLVKILSGAESPDSGTIRVAGRSVVFPGPQAAQQAGIATIHQELSLVPQLSVAENVLLGELPRRRLKTVSWSTMRAQAREAIQRIGFELDVQELVGNLSVAEQQAVELAKALHRDARVLLLDEPTSTLPPPDVRRLFDVLTNLAHEGVSMLYISHRMDEIYSLCDSVSVLRDGRLTATFDTADSQPTDVVSSMVGRALEGSLAEGALRGDRSPRIGGDTRGRVFVSVRNLSEATQYDDVSFDIHEGEVLGITGLVGSGQSELASCLAGARTTTGGNLSVDGKDVRLSSPRDAIRLGIGLLPQDRKSAGFVPDMSVAENITLASQPLFSRFAVRDERREKSEARRLAERLGMRIYGVEQPVKTLSGGTQQKAIIARWLVRSTRLLICDEPTRGVDVGAKEDIYELLREFAQQGGTVVVASSEIPEALMCDRVLVMASGRMVAELDHDDIDPGGEQIIQLLG